MVGEKCSSRRVGEMQCDWLSRQRKKATSQGMLAASSSRARQGDALISGLCRKNTALGTLAQGTSCRTSDQENNRRVLVKGSKFVINCSSRNK